MNKIKNENGYALIIVLFVIIFIVILTAVFMRSSLSNIKQEYRVDESNLTVTTAEAGVDYYTWELEVVYNNNKEYFNNLVEDYIKQANFKKIQPNYENIQFEIAKELKTLLENRAKILASKSYDLYDYKHKLFLNEGDIKITKIEPSKGTSSFFITVNGKVVANFDGEYEVKKTLSFQQSYTIPNFNRENPQDGIEIGKEIDIPSWIDKNKPTEKCTNKQTLVSKCYADHDKYIDQVEKLEKAEVYVDKQFNTKENLELKKGSDLFVREDLKVKGELDLENKSRLFIGKDLHVFGKSKGDEGDFELEDGSYVYVQRNVDVDGELELEDKSYMYVGGKMDIKEKLELQNNSSLFVGGVLTVGNKGEVELEGSSKVCAKELKLKGSKLENISSGSFIYYLTESDVANKNIIKVDTLEALKSKCGFIGNSSNLPSPGTPTWEDPIIENVIY